MALAQGGDRAAYRALLLAITPYVRAVASRAFRTPADVEDVAQDILLTVHETRSLFDPARPFMPWLSAIARHRVIDRLRRNGRTRAREVVFGPEHETFYAGTANQDSIAADAPALRAAVAALPDGQRRAVEMLKLQEMSLQQAQAASGMSIAALKVATHRALKRLRLLLGDPGAAA